MRCEHCHRERDEDQLIYLADLEIMDEPALLCLDVDDCKRAAGDE